MFYVSTYGWGWKMNNRSATAEVVALLTVLWVMACFGGPFLCKYLIFGGG